MPIPKIEKEINHLEVKEIKYNVNQDGINELKKSYLQLREKYFNLLEKYTNLLERN